MSYLGKCVYKEPPSLFGSFLLTLWNSVESPVWGKQITALSKRVLSKQEMSCFSRWSRIWRHKWCLIEAPWVRWRPQRQVDCVRVGLNQCRTARRAEQLNKSANARRSSAKALPETSNWHAGGVDREFWVFFVCVCCENTPGTPRRHRFNSTDSEPVTS